MQKAMRRLRIALLFALVFVPFGSVAAALDVPPVPQDIPIVDQAEVLTPEQEQAIAQKIANERGVTGNQVGVLTIKSLEGEAIEDYSLQVARLWGIGSKERNNGVLLLVAVNDRKLRIEVGYGLEGALPDIRANHIIQDRITPAFRQNDYYKGIDSGVDGILLAIHNERDPAIKADKKPASAPRLPWDIILIGLFIIPSWLGAMLARTKSWWAGGVVGLIIAGIIVAFIGLTLYGVISLVVLPIIGLLFDKAVSRNYRQRTGGGFAPSWWAGGPFIGGGRSGGSGGFGGFGGGSFGGGGSSGDW